MRFRILGTAMLFLCFACGCDRFEKLTEQYYIQDIAHLHLENTLQKIAETTEIRAVWIPVMCYENWLSGKSEAEFQETVREAFQNCVNLGLNTVFVHIRAYGDAYYHSALFPKGIYHTGEFDPLGVMLKEAHEQGLAFHAWVNPLRLQTEQQFQAMPDSFLLKQWYDDPEKNGTVLVNVDGRYYLNPAYPEARQLVADGVKEIMQNYAVDGIHIDDYFYPTTEASFDETAFSESDADNLAEWRKNNCSALIKLLYQTVKEQNAEIPFSISPQGNFRINEEELYADVKLWATEPGYCDILIPQIYYGFQNEVCPFAETVQQWTDTVTVPKLVVGLGVYKIGLPDKWAGSGQDEWTTDSTVISRELQFVSDLHQTDGIAFYSYLSLFEPEQDVSVQVNAEKNQIAQELQKERSFYESDTTYPESVPCGQ